MSESGNQEKWQDERGYLVGLQDGNSVGYPFTRDHYRLLVENSSDAILVNRSGQIEYVNPAALRLLGAIAPEQLIGKSTLAILRSDYLPAVQQRRLSGSMEPMLSYSEERWYKLDGESVEVEVAATPFFDEHGFAMQIVARDISARKRVAEVLRQSEKRYRTILQAMTDGVFVIQNKCVVFANHALPAMLGYPYDEFIGCPLESIIAPECLELWMESFEQLLGEKHNSPCNYEVRLLRKENPMPFWALLYVSLTKFNGKPAVLGFIRDITYYKETAAKLEAERQRSRRLTLTVHNLFEEKEVIKTTLASIGDGVITTDNSGAVTFLNTTAERLTGWCCVEAIGQPITAVFQAAKAILCEDSDCPVKQAMHEEETAVGEEQHAILTHKDGQTYLIEDSCAPIRNQYGEIFGCVLVFRDVTAARAQIREIQHQATHDALTGLINRREFEQRLKRVLRTSAEEQSHILLYLDLDQFKIVNDSCGHFAGDELLRQVAEILTVQVRHRDTVARLGGDEFGILLEHCDLLQGQRIAEAVRLALQNFRFVWQGKAFGIGISIGLVSLTEQCDDLTQALKAADNACYAAKEHGRNRIHVFVPDDHTVVQRQGEMSWISRIQQALAEDRFCLYFQPIVSLHGDSISGLHGEVLLRMIDESGKLVAPGNFIPAIERYQQMVAIDTWVIRNLFDLLRRSPELNKQSDYLLAVNISGQSLGNEAFHQLLLDEINHTQIRSECLCFEITETSAITNLRSALKFMNILRKLHCRFALDDFGSGLSSFNYLKTLPVDFLKIDGSFVRNLAQDPLDMAVVEAIHKVGHSMGIETIAEAVETTPAIAKLKAIGVDCMQGFAIAKPRLFQEIL